MDGVTRRDFLQGAAAAVAPLPAGLCASPAWIDALGTAPIRLCFEIMPEGISRGQSGQAMRSETAS